MTDKTPHFPGKPNAIGVQPDPAPWSKFICPYSLSGAIGRLGPYQEKLVVTPGVQKSAEEGFTPFPCIGPACALFCQTKHLSGCAHVIGVLETNRLRQTMEKFLDAISENDASAAPTTPDAPAAPTGG